MKKLLMILSFVAVVPCASVRAENMLARDTNDPLYILGIEEFLSESSLTYLDSKLRLGQAVSYGLTNRLSVAANILYQFDFDGSEDGFSAADIGGVYRLARATDNKQNVVSDVIVGMKLGGSRKVRTPEFADSTLYAGLRFGRQWAAMTLAATVQSNWIFDDINGMAYIDLTPEAYFRIAPDWRLGANFTLRKATNSAYDQEWIGGKVVRQFGRTQYVGHIDYEFESDDVQIGANVNILF